MRRGLLALLLASSALAADPEGTPGPSPSATPDAAVSPAAAAPSPSAAPSATVASPTPTSAAETPAPSPSPTPAATATATVTPVASATPAATASPTPSPEPSPTPRPAGLGAPVLFRGECTPGGGSGGCRIVAAGLVTGDAITPLACDSAEEQEWRRKIAERYFVPGHALDLYVRGAPSGSFVVEKQDEPPRGCANRARGRRVGSPGRVVSFVALDPEDPVKLSTLRFPTGVQADARDVALVALKAEPFNAQAVDVGLHEVRRLREGETSVLVLETTTSRGRVILIAEGEGRDPAGWKTVWTSAPDEQTTLVDIFDLGADQKTEILLERLHRGEPSEWVLLRRDDKGWSPVLP